MEHKYDEKKQTPCAKKVIKILLSISIVSFLIISLSPYLLPLLIQWFDHYTATFSLSSHLFRYSSERNYIFLFCNGILFLVIKTSVLKGNSFLGSQSTIQEVSNTHKELSKPSTKDITMDYEEEEEEEVNIHDNDEEEDGIGLLSAEELNRKCDDFIRKIREGIRVEVRPTAN
ncbi:uncharacterized protein LOC124931706 [Impatiens glandulifera]|uniref:uncharacterized protein LOC124931706 n=1 Tax=Impatiens glandulifera TaxID=253017 RepID=UPI001FB16D69|nr:uncharacterized protein LOC124931706 [Impatiens glandulifera]